MMAGYWLPLAVTVACAAWAADYRRACYYLPALHLIVRCVIGGLISLAAWCGYWAA